MSTSPLQDRLKAPISDGEIDRWDIKEVRLRLPRLVMSDLKLLAEAKGISVNALAAIFIDAGLVNHSRKSIDETAPWFANYLRASGRPRQQGNARAGADPDFT